MLMLVPSLTFPGSDKILIMTKEEPITRTGRKTKRILPISSDVILMPTDKRTERTLKRLKSGKGASRCDGV